MSRKKFESFSYETARLEGGLFVRDLLEQCMLGTGSYQKSSDYGIENRLFSDAAGIAWQDAKSYHSIYRRSIDRTSDKNRPLRTFANSIMGAVLGYGDIGAKKHFEEAGRGYNVYITEFGKTPFLFSTEDLDEPSVNFAVAGSGRRKLSAFSHLQEFLNASPEFDWGIVFDGHIIRLLRDSSSLSRPAWLEFDMEKMFAEDRYSDFCAMWRILHSSRAVKTKGVEIWEHWQTEGAESGARVKEALKHNVEQAICALGSGFINNEKNTELRAALSSGTLTEKNYYAQLLRLIYRVIFIVTLEERGILQTADSSLELREIYQEGYSMRRLRDRSLWVHDDSSAEEDLWVAAEIVMHGLANGCPELGLPALGGLFSPSLTPNLNNISLDNQAFLAAMKYLRWSVYGGKNSYVDYKNMDSEEMGSLYENLLAFIPKADVHAGTFKLESADNAGNERKKSGSYYTPTALVSELLDSTLEPLLNEKLTKAADKEEALLSLAVLDPACGSGHFLVAAARKLADRLAALRAGEEPYTPAEYRRAMRDIISHCIYGVDLNPMALELCKTVLWLESFDGTRPMSFLDAHLVCGNSILGVIDQKIPLLGIPDEAYKALKGDDAALCRALKVSNKKGLEEIRKNSGQTSLFEDSSAQYEAKRRECEAMPDDTVPQVEAKAHAFAALKAPDLASEIYMAAFLAPKNAESETLPTSRELFSVINGGDPEHLKAIVESAKELCAEAGVLNWNAVFPLVMRRGGFDCIIGNPPWERPKLQQKEWFAQRIPEIAGAHNKAERERMIAKLKTGALRDICPEATVTSENQKKIYREYLLDSRIAEAESLYAHTGSAEYPGRYPLTGTGDVNLYALFAETVYNLLAPRGRAGIIVPTGIATDDTTKLFFAKLVSSRCIGKMLCFENRKKIFPDVDSRINFALLVMAEESTAAYSVFLHDIKQKSDERRLVTLTEEELALMNPNTLTLPVIRTVKDKEIALKIYKKVPALIKDADEKNGNPWQLSFMRMLDMSNDSRLFRNSREENNLPLYEGKMIHQFDSRWATFDVPAKEDDARNLSVAEKADSACEPKPRYWVRRDEVWARTADAPLSLRNAFAAQDIAAMAKSLTVWLTLLDNIPLETDMRQYMKDRYGFSTELPDNVCWYAEARKKEFADCTPLCEAEKEALIDADLSEWVRKLMEERSPRWFLGWRDVTNATNERTVIASVIPQAGINHKILIIKFQNRELEYNCPLLMANFSSIVLDYIARLKIGGVSMSYYIFKQLPILPPTAYTPADISYITQRVIELVYTAESLRPWAEEMGYKGDPYTFNPDRRAKLRAELDACYARLYGLSREEMHYILDPAEVMGEDYPTQTFSGLKTNELRDFGEYRTKKLILAAWDKMEMEQMQK